MAENRLYRVHAKKSVEEKDRLVSGTSLTKVREHLLADLFDIQLATPSDVADVFLANGGNATVEKAQ